MGEANILNKLPVSASIFMQKICLILLIIYMIKKKKILK